MSEICLSIYLFSLFLLKKYYPSLGLGNTFAFTLEDRKGRIHHRRQL
uniref:Uncharacterized protein n=1 Tax=Nelumbo nucifera TaxID=4432 RepID=A0A822YBZ0_NELNU|nr:TPA_asm: hypothetical protein HUJ06_030499 [Nelumbo nucifera]